MEANYLLYARGRHRPDLAVIQRSSVWMAGDYLEYGDMNREGRYHLIPTQRDELLDLKALHTQEKQCIVLKRSGMLDVVKAPSNGSSIRSANVYLLRGARKIACHAAFENRLYVAYAKDIQIFDLQKGDGNFFPAAKSCLLGMLRPNVLLHTDKGTGPLGERLVLCDLRSRTRAMEIPFNKGDVWSCYSYLNDTTLYLGGPNGIGYGDLRKPGCITAWNAHPVRSLCAFGSIVVGCGTTPVPDGRLPLFTFKSPTDYHMTLLPSIAAVDIVDDVIVAAG